MFAFLHFFSAERKKPLSVFGCVLRAVILEESFTKKVQPDLTL